MMKYYLVFLLLVSDLVNAEGLIDITKKIDDRSESVEDKLDVNNKLLNLAINPWEKTNTYLPDLMRQSSGGCHPDVLKYEFMIERNGGMRKLSFSTYNGGCRAVTDLYIVGDYWATNGPYTGLEGPPLTYGGSFWFYGTKDEKDDPCINIPRTVYHSYFRLGQYGISYLGTNSVRNNGEVICSREKPLYKRKRIFKEEVAGLLN